MQDVNASTKKEKMIVIKGAVQWSSKFISNNSLGSLHTNVSGDRNRDGCDTNEWSLSKKNCGFRPLRTTSVDDRECADRRK